MPPHPFGDYVVRMDPWEATYGSELPLDTAPEETTEDVDVGVERAADEWAPIAPPLLAATARPPLRFVDGVRRLEARLVVTRDGRVSHGALGSFAAGIVSVDAGRAVVSREEVGRVVAFGSGERAPAPIALGQALEYEPASTAATDADGPLLVIHERMRQLEATLSREAASAPDDALVICDGPLTFGELSRGRAVGFVKRLFRLYVPDGLRAVLASLRVGQRSPLFAIGGTGKFGRYAWYVRLAEPLAFDADLTGLARLEVVDAVGLDVARATADTTAALLPAFVPGRGRDPRAPQNLLPIGALEAQLRRRMGDIRIVRHRFAALVVSNVFTGSTGTVGESGAGDAAGGLPTARRRTAEHGREGAAAGPAPDTVGRTSAANANG